MTIRTGFIRRIAVLAAVLFAAAPVGAQSLKDLSGAVCAVTGGGSGLRSVDQASSSNLTGVLEYSVKNKYLGGGSGGNVPGKLTGSSKTSDKSTFKAGSGGMLETGDGDGFSLGGSGIQDEVTEQVYHLVLKHTQSLL